MTTQTERAHDLLGELVESFTDHPLTIEATEHPGVVYWEMHVHADDYGKVVGKQGTHIKALTAVLKALGTASDELYKFKLHEPVRNRRRDDLPPKQATHYDPRIARDLLCRILESLGLGQFAVEAKMTPAGKIPIEVLFEVSVRTDEDYRALTVPPEGPIDGLSVVAALGTLFRAHANKAGIRMQIEVLRP